ncbi:hypothetical protein R84981_002831 [Carnimonas sp. R-84981]|uniref:DUF1073 domain-containing protein n=1 Tax=Carnimonas bestiolae TaxID=3402172 RepID=UPI003EDC01D7
MARTKKNAPRSVDRKNQFVTADGYENFVARVGMHTQNQSAAGGYLPNFTSRNRLEIEWAYRSSWIIGAAVDAIADDMTRRGIRITSEIDAHARGMIESELDRLEIWDKLNDTLKWSRLYGGAVGYLMIDGQDPKTPLNLDTVGEGQFKGILPLDRWMLNPDLSDRIDELGPNYTQPKFYDLVTTGTGLQAWRIHHSRLIRFDGVTLPYQQKITENEWGMSVVERIWERLTAFDSTTQGAAQLVYKAHLRTYKVEGLRQMIAMGGQAYDGFLKHIDMIRQFQSNEGMTLMDAKDEFDTHQYSFSGLDNLLDAFSEQISGAVGIPLVRLFGQSPKGFSTGESDLANYYDTVQTQQERRLRNPLRKVLDLISRSTGNGPLADDFTFAFNPLWQMSDVERSTTAVNTVNALAGAVDSGLMTPRAAAIDLRENSDVTGVGASISDEEINQLQDDPAPEARISGDDRQEADLSPREPRGDEISAESVGDSAPDRSNRSRILRWLKRG